MGAGARMGDERGRKATHWGRGGAVGDETGKAGCGQIQESRFYSVNNKNQWILSRALP